MHLPATTWVALVVALGAATLPVAVCVHEGAHAGAVEILGNHEHHEHGPGQPGHEHPAADCVHWDLDVGVPWVAVALPGAVDAARAAADPPPAPLEAPGSWDAPQVPRHRETVVLLR